MIERNRIDYHKFAQIILKRHVISMPSYYIERTMVLLGSKQFSLVFSYYFRLDFFYFIPKNIFGLIFSNASFGNRKFR